MSNIVVKFQWNNELRRVTIENTQTFEQIGNLIKNLFKDAPASFSLKYRDEDGDVIILSSDIELKEAFKSSPVRFVIVDTTLKNKVETKKEEVDQDDDEDDEQDLPFNFLFKLLSALPSERRNTVPAPRCDGPHKLFGIPIIPQSQKHQNPLSTQYPTPFLKVRPQQPVESETIKIPIPTLGPFFKIRPAQLQKASQKIPIRFASQPSDETDQSLPNVEKTPETGPTEKIPVEITSSTLENTNASVETTPAVEADLTIPEEPTTSEQHIEESSEKDIENTETQEPGKVHPFESNLNQLESMGFVDREENIRLLVNNNGDIVKTVADLRN